MSTFPKKKMIIDCPFFYLFYSIIGGEGGGGKSSIAFTLFSISLWRRILLYYIIWNNSFSLQMIKRMNHPWRMGFRWKCKDIILSKGITDAGILKQRYFWAQKPPLRLFGVWILSLLYILIFQSINMTFCHTTYTYMFIIKCALSGIYNNQ